MNSRLHPGSLVLLLFLNSLSMGMIALRAAEKKSELAVMTFNLRYASSNSPNSWPVRRPAMGECIRSQKPDLIGTQEGLYGQLKDLQAEVPDYEWIGLGREGGSKGEFMAVFYRKDRLNPLEFDHFWLSDTPNVIGSTTWGNSNRRMVTWVLFEEKETKRTFYFLNTHFDHQIQKARVNSAKLVRERLAGLKPGIPIILGGDFNATAGKNEAYDILVNAETFQDAWVIAKKHKGEIVHTFHNFRGPTPGDNRIDWILLKGGFAAKAVEIVTFSKNGQFPSDHFPVMAWLDW